MLWNTEYIHCDKWSNTEPHSPASGEFWFCPSVQEQKVDCVLMPQYFTFHVLGWACWGCILVPGTGKNPHSAGKGKAPAQEPKLWSWHSSCSLHCQVASAHCLLQVGKNMAVQRQLLYCSGNQNQSNTKKQLFHCNSYLHICNMFQW